MKRILILSTALLLAACGGSSSSTAPPVVVSPPPPPPPVVQAGNRKVGIAPVTASGEELGDIVPGLDGVGARYIEASYQWDDIETSPGVFTYPEDPSALNTFLETVAWHASLAINGIDTNTDRRPDYLRSRDWDDPVLIDAYWAMVLDILSKFPDGNVDGVAIGNEVDVYLSANPSEQDAYIAFVETISSRLKAQFPWLVNGSKTTASGFLGSSRDFVTQLNVNTDTVMVTYYAIDSSFRALSPSAARAELNSYVAGFPGRDIQFIEIGVHASTACGSSNTLQANFVKEVFAFWDDNAAQVSLVNFLWLTDLPAGVVDNFVTYYSVDDPCFRAYLAELGWRTEDGTEKGARAVFDTEAKARGFEMR